MNSEESRPTNPTSVEEVQARLAAIVASCDDGIISKDLNGVIQSWNAGARRIFGYTADEVIGKPVTILFPPDRPDEEPQILERIRRGERLEHFETIRMRKDGRRIFVSATISPILDGSGRIIGASKIVRDITEQTRIQRMFQAIVASSDDAIVSKDLNGIVQSWNPAAERIFGYSAQEMIGASITKIIPPERPDEEPAILERLRAGERIDHFETVRLRKDGQRIDVSVTISPIRTATGQVIGASKIARDITALKRYLAEREHLLQSEHAARRELERVNRAKDEFLATLSHELRTPLNSILGWATLLRDADSDPKDLKQGLETIERNAHTQAQLINDLLDMSRIISGKLRLDVAIVDLRAVIAESIESVSFAASAKQIEIRQNLDSKAARITGDASRLQQVLWNLLINAIKFTPRGGKIDVSLARAQSHVELCVADTGQGIHPDFLSKLFTRFSQADSSTTRQHGGLGLGLALVRHLVEMHGGSVRADSAGEGKGATFTIALPIASLADQMPDDDSFIKEHQPFAAINLDGIRVLVVDDEADSRQLTQRILEGANASVVCAESAAQALALVQKQQPDVLLTDIGMPDEDGYQLIRKVRGLDPAQGGRIPAAALTAFARPEDRRHALLTGFQLHIAKPIEPADLLAAVKSLSIYRTHSSRP